MLVLFVDFGNKDLVKAEEFCIMPEKFYFFKNLPDQVIKSQIFIKFEKLISINFRVFHAV